MLSFHVKFVQTDDGWRVKQYAPDLSIRGHKNNTNHQKLRIIKLQKKFFVVVVPLKSYF